MNFLMSVRMIMTYQKTKRVGGIVLDIENNILNTLNIFKIILSTIFNKQDNALSNILVNDVGQIFYKHYTEK